MTKDVPGLVTIAGFECRVWYRRQPAFCAICRKLGHRSRAWPLNGLCQRCRRPGHHARDYASAWAPAADAVPGAARPPRPAEASADAAAVRDDAVPPRPAPAVDPVPPSDPPNPVDASAVQEAEMSDGEYVPPAGANSDVSSGEDEDLASGDDALASGDEEVIAAAVSSSTSDSPRHRRKIRTAQFRPPPPMCLLAWISLCRRVLVTSTLRPFVGCGKTRFLGRKSLPRNLVIGFVQLRSLHPLFSLPLPILSLLLLSLRYLRLPLLRLLFLLVAPFSILCAPLLLGATGMFCSTRVASGVSRHELSRLLMGGYLPTKWRAFESNFSVMEGYI